MPAPRKYDQETRDRAVRMYQERRRDFPDESLRTSRRRVGELLDVNPETMRGWIEQIEVDTGRRSGVSSEVAVELQALRRENAELRLRAGPETNLTGASQVVAGLRGAVQRVAPTGSRVLIAGPAGSGKEVVARMVHANSRRADGPFVALNCATLAPVRFEEELFGIEAGNVGWHLDGGQRLLLGGQFV